MSDEPAEILIRDGGELSDVREALHELGLSFCGGNVERSAPARGATPCLWSRLFPTIPEAARRWNSGFAGIVGPEP
jgi:hypothetical protein